MLAIVTGKSIIAVQNERRPAMEVTLFIRSLTESQLDRLMEIMTIQGWSVTDAFNYAKNEILAEKR